jgi:hypothetical protein
VLYYATFRVRNTAVSHNRSGSVSAEKDASIARCQAVHYSA